MKLSSNTILLPVLLLPGLLLGSCSNDPYRGFYEGIKTQNEGYKTPTERLNAPSTPNYDTYQKERERLLQTDHASEKNESTDFNLK